MNEQNWHIVGTALLNELKKGESLALSLSAEDSLFVRMTQAKVRQSSEVQQGFVELNFFKNNCNLKMSVPFTFQPEKDLQVCQEALRRCREEAVHLPEDKFIQLPSKHGQFHQDTSKKIDGYSLVDHCLDRVQGADFVGILSAGDVIRANLNSRFLNQWFKTSTFSLDCSFYAKNRQAVKGLYGGQLWQNEEFETLIVKKLHQLEQLNKPLMTLEKKKYRAYFSPSAVATLMESLSGGLASREAYQRGQCAFKKLVDGKQHLSPMFSLQENFTGGQIPPFNEVGEIGPEILSVVEQGRFKNLLCSSRSAKEYNVTSNFASTREALRAPEILPGHLPGAKEMEALGTGIYVSDLHYLNWSDIQQGSITGMTRFGCFWVENGQIVAPVKDLRFDESLYHFWGTGLEGFTDKAETHPKTGTYFERDLGSIKAPGMLVNDFTFVL
ncbi:MAG: metallopeptidase TldD-related protein [Candidatus Paracaedibacter sp.]